MVLLVVKDVRQKIYHSVHHKVVIHGLFIATVVQQMKRDKTKITEFRLILMCLIECLREK